MCDDLFEFPCSATSTCYWRSRSSVDAFVYSETGCAKPGDQLSLHKSASIKAYCDPSIRDCSLSKQWLNMSLSTSMTIGYPLSPVNPIVIISGPMEIGSCDSLLLDVSVSSGSHGQDWQSTSISVYSNNPSNITEIRSYLNSSFDFYRANQIPSHLLMPNTIYSFTVTLCNVWLNCSSGLKRVLVHDSSIPTVTIHKSAVTAHKRSKPLTVYSSGSFIDCSYSGSVQAKISYEWLVYVDGILQLDVSSSSKDPSIMKLPSHSLIVGNVYQFSVRVSVGYKSSSSFVYITVQAGEVVAIIEGSSEKSVHRGELYTLDGSSSYDEDIFGLTGDSTGLIFDWNCEQTLPAYNNTCRNALVSGFEPSDCNNSTCKIKSNSQVDMNTILKVTLTVHDFNSTRCSSASVLISFISSTLPTIELSNNLVLNTLNSDNMLRITSLVQMTPNSSTNCSWTSNSDWQLSYISSTPVSYYLTSPANHTATISIYLVVVSNSLIQGNSYSFSIRCVDPLSGYYSSASMTVNVNSPPSSGTFSVTPSIGTALETTFIYIAARWEDSDTPLRYSMGYYSSSSYYLGIQSISESNTASANLPSGDISNNYSVTCIVRVFDSFQANSTMTRIVYVIPWPNAYNMSKVEDYVSNAISSADDVNKIMRVMSLSGYLLNFADCSFAPNCSSLHRASCTNTENTCGECLNGYIGISGDSNDRCWLDDKAQSRRLLINGHNNMLMQSYATFCFSSEDCSSTYICDNSVCVKEQKHCPNSCNGHGICRYKSYNTNLPWIGSCYVDESDCYSYCECEDKYRASQQCNVISQVTSNKSKLRLNLLSLFDILLSWEESSLSSVEHWLGSLTLLSQNPFELTSEISTRVMNISKVIISSLAENEIDYNKAILVLKALDSVSLALLTANSSEDSTNSAGLGLTFIDLLTSYSDYVTNQMVANQNPFEHIFSTQMKLTTQKLPSYSLNNENQSFSLPRNSLEISSNSLSSSIEFVWRVVDLGRDKASFSVGTSTRMYNVH